uniref:Exocyst subunit Exo70 family protein n=1 Tax=Oryza sativa TaxID=4530 RepID=Q259N6_ORYSA|nr:H0723C07.3 [Oryza sativa]
METLAQRAALLRESLQKSQSVTDAVVSILGSFDSRLSALDAAMRPIQVRTHAVRTAHENIDRTLRSADVILTQFDRTREVLHRFNPRFPYFLLLLHMLLTIWLELGIVTACSVADECGERVVGVTVISPFSDLHLLALGAEREIQKGPHENLQGFLDAVDRLRSIERFFSSNRSYRSSDGVLNHVNALLSKALVKMEDEFQKQLTQRSKPIEPDRLFDCLPSTLRPSSESHPEGGKNQSHSENQQNSEAAVYSPPALIEPRFIPFLAKLAQQLVQAGCQQQCSEIYSEARASALESSLKSLGVEKLSKDEVQKMPWEILESKIGNWIHFMRIAVKLLFAAERQLCDQVFECSQSLRDKCFAQITRNSLATLLSFGEAIAMSKRSPEKLFVLLDMYEIMCELQADIDTIFVGESCSQMRESALSLTKCLAQTAQKTFSDFEEAVEKDATKNIHIDGTVHPLTSYVINYVKFLFDYQSTLKQLFQEFKGEDGTGSELATVTMSIMQALQNNLDAKAKQYKDPALMHIFLMNNIHYIVKSVRRSEAKDLLGDDWIQRHRRIVQQNANHYRRIAWSKVLQCLSGQGLTSSGGSGQVGSEGGNSSGASRAAVKERSFNVLFEEIYQKQCGWSVPDTELRESLRLAVAEILLPAYRSFLKRFGLSNTQEFMSLELMRLVIYRPLIENSKAPGKYVKHTPEQVELLLANLFEGKQERT